MSTELDEDQFGDDLVQLQHAIVFSAVAVGNAAARRFSNSGSDDRPAAWRATVEALAFLLHAVDRAAFRAAGADARQELLDLLTDDLMPFCLRVFWERVDDSVEFLDWLSSSSNLAQHQLAEADAEFSREQSLMGDEKKVFNAFTKKMHWASAWIE